MKKIVIACDSMSKTITICQTKKSLKHQQINRECFQDINVNHFNYFIVLTLVEDKLNIIVAHMGTSYINDVLSKAGNEYLI